MFDFIEAAREAGLPLPEFKPGQVWLVGAGPGDPGLLALLALHGLHHADVVFYDTLIDSRVLGLAAPEAELIDCGRPSCRNNDICDGMITQARRGRRVLRLKGGDPMMFGCGAEEALSLAAAGVPFRVVPGISSGLGGLAAAGIPLTCRGINESVTFATGHDKDGEASKGHDWTALARSSAVLVLFTAIRDLSEIVPLLLAGGRSADEPVAIVHRATTMEQRVTVTSLGECAAIAIEIEPPALVVIGEVVRLRRELAPQFYLPM
ncbi:MAG: uroporphyrinogen-III C-methyltransferase [Rhodospirillaceae bacterium]